MKFKAIFWDNDGTLVNTEPLFFKATQLVLGEIGIDLTRAFYMEQCLKFNRSAFDLAREQGVDEAAILDMRQDRNGRYMDLLRKGIPVIPGIPELLERLHGHIRMGVATSSHRDHFEAIMDGSGLRDFFEFTITSDDVAEEKPAPDLYLAALEVSGLRPEEALVIEDTERGLVAAKAAGLTCFVVPNELSKHNDFSKADRVLERASDLIELI